MKKNKPSEKRPKGIEGINLSEDAWEELAEYTHQERVEYMKMAICGLAEKGVLSPKVAREYLKNIEDWLIQIFMV